MKEELLNKFTGKLLVYANDVKSFASKEIPLYIQELLEYNFIEHITSGIISLFFLMFGVGSIMGAFYIAYVRSKKNEHTVYYGDILLFSIIPLFCIILSAPSAYYSTLQAYKIKNAPRVYIIDYLRDKRR